LFTPRRGRSGFIFPSGGEMCLLLLLRVQGGFPRGSPPKKNKKEEKEMMEMVKYFLGVYAILPAIIGGLVWWARS